MSQQPASVMPFLDHLRELRRRVAWVAGALVVGAVAAFAAYDLYIPLLLEPFGQDLFALGVEEAFVMKLRLAGYGGVILALPMGAYQTLAFILPALESAQRRWLAGLVVGGFGLGLGGAAMAYFQVLPWSIGFLGDPAFLPEQVRNWLSFERAVNFACQLVLAFGLLFQLPIVMLMLLRLGIVHRGHLLAGWRYVVVVLYLAAAILTPPDIPSQLALGTPLIFLYFGTILLAKVLHLGDPPDEGPEATT